MDYINGSKNLIFILKYLTNSILYYLLKILNTKIIYLDIENQVVKYCCNY